MKHHSELAILILMTALLLLGTSPTQAVAKDYPAAPDFVLKDLNGKEIRLGDYKGKVLFLNFWATWCGPCRAEIPDFIEAYNEHKKDGLEILGISVDQAGAKKVLKFVEANKVNYPVAMATKQLFKDYQRPRAIPTTLIIDRKGRIRHKQVGLMSKEMVIQFFKEFSKAD